MKKKILILCCFFGLLIRQVHSQNSDTIPKASLSGDKLKSFGLFKNDELLQLTLQFNLGTYIRTRSKEEYLPARMTIHLSKTDSITRDIKLRARGVFRHKYCTFSPIELNLKHVNFGYKDLNKISKIKLVPECRGGQENENYVLKEYLAYKLYNALTDTSFRVRLLTINYIDSEKKRKETTQYGFLIEPVEMLAERTKTVEINTPTLDQKSIMPMVMDRFSIFNYMIGNYDWAVPGLHNVKVLKSMVPATIQLGIAVPYDFDWTGLVNADYAIPAEIIGTQTVRERIFEGVCRSRTVFKMDLIKFSEMKEEFYRIINEFPYLKSGDKKDITRYLDEFYDQFTGDKILDIFENSCKNF